MARADQLAEVVETLLIPPRQESDQIGPVSRLGSGCSCALSAVVGRVQTIDHDWPEMVARIRQAAREK
jgi:hypothetical protein